MRVLRGRAAVRLLLVSGVVLAACGDDENLQPVLDTSVTEPPSSDPATGTAPTSESSSTADATATTDLSKTNGSRKRECNRNGEKLG